MSYTRRALLCLAAATGLSACANSHVGNATAPLDSGELKNVLIVLREGSFVARGARNHASYGGDRLLAEVTPVLLQRLPVVFEAKGITARAITGSALPSVRMAPGEKLLVITPGAAAYGQAAGTMIAWRAELSDPVTRKTLWSAEINAKSWGGGALDQGVADQIGNQILGALLAARS